VFLREQVERSGMTLKALEPLVNMPSSQISVYLSGRIPGSSFVIALVNATVPADLREPHLNRALDLRHKAINPPRIPEQARGPVMTSSAELAAIRTQQVDALERLTRSLEPAKGHFTSAPRLPAGYRSRTARSAWSTRAIAAGSTSPRSFPPSKRAALSC
jgi:hypothetical protein